MSEKEQLKKSLKQKIKKWKREERTLYNDQGINPRRRGYNNCKYLYTQC